VRSVKRFALLPLVLLLLGADSEAVKLLNEGIRAARLGNLKAAVGFIERANAIDAHEAPDYQVHFWHGVVLSALGYEAAALQEWEFAARTPELTRRLVAMKVKTPQSLAENARSDAIFLNAQRTKSFQAGEEAMKAGRYDDARALYARALSEPRPELYTLARPVIHLPLPGQTATTGTAMTATVPVPMPAPPPPPTHTAGTTEGMTATVPTTTTTTTTAATTSTTASPTSTAPDIFEKIKEEFANLSPGTIAFNAPDRMKVSEAEQVTVRIAPKGEAAGITSGLSGQTTTASQEHITPTMAARLDGLGFEITALTPETQLVAGGGFTEWRWSVTPTDSGDHNLNVSIIAKLDQYERVVGTETHAIHVDGNPMAAVTAFFRNNWQWLASAIVIPLIALLWRSRAKRQD
jgi:hypothetical protein